MADGLPIIIVDDDTAVSDVITQLVRKFYVWGDVITFTDPEEAVTFCQSRSIGVAVFVLDVYLGQENCFDFLDAIQERFPMAYHDSIIITGNADTTIVDACVASDIHHLLEKPIKPYALQFAVRAIVSKYIKFAKKLLQDPALAEYVAAF